ncbi:MAG: Vi polysaccharide biosynthesis UDP-N-acetylglucosamine C-6 dehydrogenase TviB, partial [Paraburkholderia sp.]|nr:Vi polysaccharide biosynthesis UDP-N-acetylglucosamine C-6 dehydrogenase TviB [Paraburkholderia sp.]
MNADKEDIGMLSNKTKIGVIGLGYVGLPLAVEFGKHRGVVGFDISRPRIDALKEGRDSTLEVSEDELVEARGLTFTCNPADLHECTIFIATVPTPIDEFKRPDLTALYR